MYKITRLRDYSLILLAFFLQIIFAGNLSLFDAKPNFLIIITIFFALFSTAHYGLETGFLCGFLLDMFSLRLFGLNTLLFSTTGYFIGRFNTKIYKESVLTHGILIFFASVFILSAYRLSIMVENHFLTEGFHIGAVLSPSVFLSAAYNSFLGILIFTFLCRIFDLGETSIL